LFNRALCQPILTMLDLQKVSARPQLLLGNFCSRAVHIKYHEGSIASRKFMDPARQLFQWDIHGAATVPRLESGPWTDIQDEDENLVQVGLSGQNPRVKGGNALTISL